MEKEIQKVRTNRIRQYAIEKMIIYQTIGIVIAFLLAIIWFGQLYSSLSYVIVITIISMLVYTKYEDYYTHRYGIPDPEWRPVDI